MKRGTKTEKETGSAQKESKEQLHTGSEKAAEAMTGPGGESEHRRTGIRRVLPWGRHARGGEGGEESGAEQPAEKEKESRVSVSGVKERARKGLSRLRERAPSGEELRGWAEQQPMAVGLGVLAIGFGIAALIPPSRAERKALGTALGAAQQFTASLDSARKLASNIAGMEQKPQSGEAPQETRH